MVTGSVAKSLGWRKSSNIAKESTDKVNLHSLSEMTGFPLDFIKKELMVEQEELSVDDLRLRVAQFLDATLGNPTSN